MDETYMNNYTELRQRMLKRYNDLILSDRWISPNRSLASANSVTLTDTVKTPHSNGGTPTDLPKDSKGKTIALEDYSTPPGHGQPISRKNKNVRFGRQWWCPLCPNDKAETKKGRWGNHSGDRHDDSKLRRNNPSAGANTTNGANTAATTADVAATATNQTTPPASSSVSLIDSAIPDFS
jgi:hypothetical protein